MAGDDCRTPFASSARAFLELVDGVLAHQWSEPGLGDWDVRGLVGHTSRGLSVVETYLRDAGSEASLGVPVLTDPIEYFARVLVEPSADGRRLQQDAAIAERGRKAGEELGADPAVAVRQLFDRVIPLVMATPDEAIFETPAGPMPLTGYLPTRTFELAVHSLDLARAVNAAPPQELALGVSVSCELAGRLAARRPHAADLLMMLTGRRGIAPGLSIL